MAAEAPVAARHTRLISRPGLTLSSRKGGWAMGDVTGFLVCTARRRQQGGDRAGSNFPRTECVAGVQDMRFQEQKPEALHWRGIRENHRLLSVATHQALAQGKGRGLA